jgi:hypothetical protein
MAKYYPNKKYTWSNDDQITISGRDFGLFLNAFRSILNTEEAARILLANEANKAIEDIIAEYVEKDIIKEVDDRPKMEVKK